MISAAVLMGLASQLIKSNHDDDPFLVAVECIDACGGAVKLPKIALTSDSPPGRYPTYLHAPVSLLPIAKTEPSPAGPRTPNRILTEI